MLRWQKFFLLLLIATLVMFILIKFLAPLNPSIQKGSSQVQDLISTGKISTTTIFKRLVGSFGATNSDTMASSQHYTTVSYVTMPNEEVARQFSKKLVENRLAACVNIVKGIESVYEWRNKIEHDNESLLIIKSHSSKMKDLTEFVEQNHPYDCPEIITLKVESGSKSYLDWVHQTISKSLVKASKIEQGDGTSKDL